MPASSDSALTIQLRFPNAREVYLLGEFNNWSTIATPLRHIGDWVWEVTVPLGSPLRQLHAFVWEQGRGFGRLRRVDAAGSLPAPG